MQLDFSNIKIPFQLNKSELGKLINAQIPAILYSNLEQRRADEILIKAEKAGDVAISAKGSSLFYRVPIKVNVVKDLTIIDAQANCAISMGFKTSFIFKEDWTMHTKTEIVEYKWLKKPQVSIGIFSLPVENILLNLIHKKRDFICEKIDEQINKLVQLRPLIEGSLKQIPNPAALENGAQIWWDATPVKTFYAPLVSEGKYITGALELRSKLKFSLGQAITPTPLVVQAPNPVRAIDNDSSLQVDFTAQYATIDNLLNDQFSGKPVDQDKYKIIPSDIQTKGKEGRLFIQANITGDFKGEIAISTIPKFLAASQEIEMNDIDLKIQGDNFKTKMIATFLTNKIESEFKKNNKVPLKEGIANLNKFIGKYPLEGGFLLNAHLAKVNLSEVNIGEDAIHLKLDANGSLGFNLEPTKVPVDDLV